jgi:hypothetical protein
MEIQANLISTNDYEMITKGDKVSSVAPQKVYISSSANLLPCIKPLDSREILIYFTALNIFIIRHTTGSGTTKMSTIKDSGTDLMTMSSRSHTKSINLMISVNLPNKVKTMKFRSLELSLGKKKDEFLFEKTNCKPVLI